MDAIGNGVDPAVDERMLHHLKSTKPLLSSPSPTWTSYPITPECYPRTQSIIIKSIIISIIIIISISISISIRISISIQHMLELTSAHAHAHAH